MGKISKDCAYKLAEFLTEKKKEAIQVLDKELSAVATKIYESLLPKGVIDFFKKHPEWVDKTKYFRLVGNGFDHESIYLEYEMPYNGSSPQPSAEDAKKLRKMYDKISDMEKELRALQKDISNAVIALGTVKKVTEVFPESTEFLEKYYKKFLPAVVNVDSIRKRLK